MARFLATTLLLSALACAPPPGFVVPEGVEPVEPVEPLRLFSHADDPRELLVLAGSSGAELARALDSVNAEELAAGRSAIRLAWIERSRATVAPPETPHTPVARVATRARFGAWLQDVFEFVEHRGRLAVLDLRRSAEGTSRLLAPLVMRGDAAWLAPPPETGPAANGGGNLEGLPDGTLLLGANAGPALAEFLLARGHRSRHVRVETGFLAVGHVDELFSHVVTGPGPCDFALVVASPELGLRFEGGRDGEDAEFVRTQRTLEARIAASAARIVETACAADRIRLPVTFSCAGPAEAPRGCVAAHPNPVNLIALRRHLLISDPGDPPRRRAITQALRGHGQKPRFVRASAAHDRGGGLHCAAQVRRAPSRQGAATMAE